MALASVRQASFVRVHLFIIHVLFAADTVVALVLIFVNVPCILHMLQEASYQLLMVLLSCADPSIMTDIHLQNHVSDGRQKGG